MGTKEIITPVFAKDAAIEGLYKFRPYPPGDSGLCYRNRVQTLLNDNTIFFSRPTTFNDPFDPRPTIVAKSLERFRYHTEKDLRQKLARDPVRLRAMISGLFKMSIEELQAMSAESTADWRKALKNDFSMYCMNSSRSSLLSWSHYADSHRGICIHFDHKLIPFSGAMKVKYDASYPMIEWPLSADAKTIYETFLLHKSPEWEYEGEFRMVRCPPDPKLDPLASNLGLVWDGQTATVNAKCITGITLGLQMGPAQREELLDICKKRTPPFVVYQANYAGDQFGLVFEQIA